MTLPVSSYEELLARVRSLTSETIQLRREITSSLCDQTALSTEGGNGPVTKTYVTHPQRTSTCEEPALFSNSGSSCLTTQEEKFIRPGATFDKKEDEFDNEFKEIDEKVTSPDTIAAKNSKTWSADNFGLWHSGPSNLCFSQPSNNNLPYQDLTTSLTCTSYEPQSLNSFSCTAKRTYSHHQLGAKVEMVYSLLSMLDTDNREDMSETFLAMSSSPESCHAMRQSGCLPLLIQLIHSSELNADVRNRAAEALHNIVHAQTDEKRRRREVRVLKLLQQVREYCEELRNAKEQKTLTQGESEAHPIGAIGTLMKFSFDAEHRQAICTLGGLHAITDLIQVDHEAHRNATEDSHCITLRRYAGMSLTNLTFGDGKNKALLCSFNKFMHALVEQLKSPSEELRQTQESLQIGHTAVRMPNLFACAIEFLLNMVDDRPFVVEVCQGRADEESKQALRNVGAVNALTLAAMEGKKESTLKSILSALWNLSAHCSLNKVDICSVPGALAFLVKMLRYKSASNTLLIVENAGGILRNISSHIAVREDYRQILRDNNCFEILLEQLKSPSLTIVSNACGTLWNLSARCPEDQKKLWEMGATSMLRSLIQSKHKMISMGSSAALKNLLAANPNENLVAHLDSTAKSLGLQNLPTLLVRKKKALEHELNITLAETCENIEGLGSPNHTSTTQSRIGGKTSTGPKRSDSRDSVKSSQSDSVYERVQQIILKNEDKLLENSNTTLHDSLNEKNIPRKVEEQKLIKRYKTSMIPLPTLKKMDQDLLNEKTKESSVVEDEHHCTEDPNEKIKKETCKMNTSTSSGDDFPDNQGCKEEKFNRRSLGGTRIFQETGETSLDFDRTNGKKNDQNVEKSMQKAKSPKSMEYINFLERKNEDSVKEMKNEKQVCSKSPRLNFSSNSEHLNNNFQTYEPNNNDKVTTGASTIASPQEVAPQRQKNERLPLGLEVGEKRAAALSSFETHSLPPAHLSSLDNDKKCSDGYVRNLDETVNPSTIIKRLDPDRQDSERGKETRYNQTEDQHNEDFNRSLNAGQLFDLRNGPKKTDDLLPNFKVGCPMTDSKVLQYEASKICREIKKQQDLGCSLTSEVSLISCSSFLDTTECSLFECSTEGIDFDESENQFSKSMTKSKNLNFRIAPGDSVSLPSLGSIKNEPIEALELDNSVLSISSFTSEVADVKDVGFDTYTKTFKNEDCQEQTIEDSTFPDGDETLNADSLRLNGDLNDDDSSLHCEENLPLDSEVYEDTVQDPIMKKLTPKEKRKTFCDRYRTYTIKDVKFVKPTATVPEVCSERENVEITSMPTHSDRRDDENYAAIKEKAREFGSIPIQGTRIESFQFSKSFDKVQESFPIEMSDSKSLNDLLSIGPDERKELADNAKLVAFSLKTAVHDFDAEIVSDSEVEELQNSSLAIDTATYNKNYRHTSSIEKLDRLHTYDDHFIEDSRKKGATVSKPEEKPESPKGVRGRRKLLYSSPQKNFRASDSNFPKCSSKNIIDPKLPKPVIQREATFTKEEASPKKTEPQTNRTAPISRNLEFKSSIPKPGAKAPVLGVSKTSKATKPSLAEKRKESDAIQRRILPTGNVSKPLGYSFSSKKSTTAGLSSHNIRGSLSNQNIKGGESSALRSRNNALQNFKSQSDANLHLVEPKDKGGKPKTSKKEATSKIASLWRKVEESKQKSKNVKDKRIWIGQEKTKTPADVLAVEQEEILEIPSRQIIHSHTYQTFTDDMPEQKEFSGGSSTVMQTGTGRRKVVSAIVQPYNYNPPTSSQTTSANLKHVDGFHKGSLKITTV